MNARTYTNFDLDIGESATYALGDGTRRQIRLIGVSEPADSVRGVIRKPTVTIDVDGVQRDVVSAHYRMPVVLNGVRLDCPITQGVSEALGGGKPSVHALDKAARIRCWDPSLSLFGEAPMVYPVKQRWFACMTQMANERTYVDAGELYGNPPGAGIYHHYGLDFGGFDRAVPIVAAAPAKIVHLGLEILEDVEWPLAAPRADVIHALGEDGRYFRYSHLDMIAANLRPGCDISSGQFLGFLGQEGGSGGWSHLHFGMFEMMPSGRLGNVEAYCFAAEAYVNENPGALLACARPHQVAAVDEPVELDGKNSICDGGRIVAWQWTDQRGNSSDGPVATRSYPKEGMYSEMLTVTDNQGRTDVDFCVVQILPKDLAPERTPPSMSVNVYPTRSLRPGQPIAFEALTFFRGPAKGNAGGREDWDFGDGATATSRSVDNYPEHRHEDYAQRWHTYAAPGRYIVTVRRTGANGLTATARVKVNIDAGID